MIYTTMKRKKRAEALLSLYTACSALLYLIDLDRTAAPSIACLQAITALTRQYRSPTLPTSSGIVFLTAISPNTDEKP